MSIGPRSGFIKSCLASAKADSLKIKGLTINSLQYCSCISDNVIPTINYKELETAMNTGKIAELFLNEVNYSKILRCLNGNMKIDATYEFQALSQNEGLKQLSIEKCITNVLANSENNGFTKSQAQEFCECFIDKIYSEKYTYKELQEIENKNSESYKKIILPCKK